MARAHGFDEGFSGQFMRAHDDPPATGIGEVAAPFLEGVGVVRGHAIVDAAAAEEVVPEFFQAGLLAAAVNIDRGVAVKDFEVAQAFHGVEVVCGEGPVEIGVVDVGEAAGVVHLVDGYLHQVANRIPFERADGSVCADAVNMDDVAALLDGDGVGYFFSGDEEEWFFFLFLNEAVYFLLEDADVGEVVVVADNEEIVIVLAVPLGHLSGCAVAAPVVGMGVGVAFKPLELKVLVLHLAWFRLRLGRGRGRGPRQKDCEGEGFIEDGIDNGRPHD